jgi:hypothetical protein
MVYVVNYAHEIIIILIKYLGCQNHGTLIGFWDLIYFIKQKIRLMSWWLNALMLLFFSSTLFPSVLSLPPYLYDIL